MVVVTGATGHIGNVLVRELVSRGERVQAVLPPEEDAAPLAGLAVEQIQGDVRDAVRMTEVLRHAETVYHLAGMISISPGRERQLREVNVEGTRNVVRACLDGGVGRLVYTSSVHAFVEPTEERVLDEEAPVDPDHVLGPYARSKAEATLAVREGVKQGLDAVIVHPSGIVGPYDYKLSEMGGLIMDAAEHKLPAYLDGAYDFADVRDVAHGMVLASEKGRKGESYILSGEIITVRDLLTLVERLTGVKAPSFRLPRWLARVVAALSPAYYVWAGAKPRFTSYSVRVLASNCRMSNRKARRELGYAPRPLFEAVRDSLRWFKETGRLR